MSTITKKSSLVESTKPSRVPSSLDEHANVTIRLSDLGVIRRSPSQLDLQIQDAKIQYILDNTIKKLQMAVCLPRLLRQDACLLHRFMEPSDIDFIANVSSKYQEPPLEPIRVKHSSFSAVLSSMDRISMHASKKKFMDRYALMRDDNFYDPHIGRVMEMLWNNRPLREMVLTEFELIPPYPCTILVDSIRKLKEVAGYKLGVSALEEKLRARSLRRLWKANEKLEEKIRRIQEQLDQQRQRLESQLEIKRNIILDHEMKIEDFKHQFKNDVRHITQTSEQDMTDDIEFSDLRQVDLSAEAKSTTQQYEGLLAQHMGIEKQLRGKRYKIEAQLCSWLAKYDADIGERQAEFDELDAGYQAEKAIVDEIQDMIDEQDEEYQKLWNQKEEEEQLMWEERAYEYLQNRSARKIQRCWRAYRQRKIDRKKARKARALARKQRKLEKAARKEAAALEAAEGGGEKKKKKDKGKGKGKGKAKGKGKGKKEVLPQSEGRGPDFQAVLQGKFGGDLLGDLQGEEFSKKEVVVDLAEGLDED